MSAGQGICLTMCLFEIFIGFRSHRCRHHVMPCKILTMRMSKILKQLWVLIWKTKGGGGDNEKPYISCRPSLGLLVHHQRLHTPRKVHRAKTITPEIMIRLSRIVISSFCVFGFRQIWCVFSVLWLRLHASAQFCQVSAIQVFQFIHGL